MSDPVNPEIIAAIQSATTAVEAQAVHEQIVASVPDNEDDVFDALKRHFKSKDAFWRSKKWWQSAAAFALSVVLPVLTAQVTWPMALAGAAGSAAVYVLSQAGVDKASATALGNVAQQAIVAKMGKKV